MIRVRVGDTLDVHFKNGEDSAPHPLSRFPCCDRPGEAVPRTQADPGQEKSFKFKALVPGLYVYHCATPMVAHHIANGMYGLILVEPEGGLPPVDREFYVMQGEIYTQAEFGQHGPQEFSVEKLLNETARIFRVQRRCRRALEDSHAEGQSRRDGQNFFWRRRAQLHLRRSMSSVRYSTASIIWPMS